MKKTTFLTLIIMALLLVANVAPINALTTIDQNGNIESSTKTMISA